MKKILLAAAAFCVFFPSHSQNKTPKKYPSLFWEISGNGMTKPSYLFGTMHVSSKMVFHLPDSFYTGIRSVDVVALETNPESWQEDLVKYDIDNSSYGLSSYWRSFRSVPDDYLNINTLRFGKYEKQIEQALYNRPSTINNLLYRNYSDYSSDFEENTYLDMYIYQVGKKMGKRVAGVERYDESMKLMLEAYRDAAKDKNRKERSFDRDDYFSPDKLQEAYRKGNLDLLDSINRLNSISEAFDEKFLYRRNELQANSIDSILRTKSSLFVGVGAAHLPGNRGVIELLRRKGYKLRPIVMGERDSRHKDMVEKLRVPVIFSTQTSDDGFYKVDIPGKFFRFGDEYGPLDQLQYADMANGSYYMVTRIKTNSGLLGHSADIVKKKIDSLLYENIPGKILSKLEIVKNGYKGWDITNRTRRGDLQRYNIFVTPFEVLIFKISGNGDYIKDGDEAKKFFGSIQLKEYVATTEWKKFQPATGGFSVELPHEPFVSKSGSWQYEAEDKSTGTFYAVMRTDIHNYSFAEEDTFDLGLLDESFASSDFIDKQLSRKQTAWKGYPALNCKYQHKDGSVSMVRFLIQGPHYYTLVTHAKKENASMQNFLNSFEIKPFVYKDAVERSDTNLYYTVKTTYYPEDKKIKLSVPGTGSSALLNSSGDDADDDDDETPARYLEMGTFRNKVIENDTTGEKIYISFFKAGRYFHDDFDTTDFEVSKMGGNRGGWIVRSKKKTTIGNTMTLEALLSDTNSSRLIWSKSIVRDGIGYNIVTEGDTLTAPSSFVKNFFDTFRPSDTLKGIDVREKKSKIFFSDYFSKDTVAHKRAIKALSQVKIDSTDFAMLKKAIQGMNWSEKKYLDTKKSFIGKLGYVPAKECSDYLKELYYAAGDTIELQYAALESLLQQQTKYAYTVFKDIITIEPPVINDNASSNGSWDMNFMRITKRINSYRNYSNGDFWDELYDSIQLARNILPDILPLVNLDDYKWRTMKLLATMIDSNLVKPKDYEIYFSKFFIEAKQAFKKQAINEKSKSIEKASNSDKKSYLDAYEKEDNGNEDLSLYAKLLLPFYETNINVPVLFKQLLQSNDKKLKYSTMLLLVKNDKAIPDTMLKYFAAMDDYRYDLYNDLDDLDELKLFPSLYNNHTDLAKSKLLASKSYGKMDSVAFADKLATEIKGKKGYVYFFKYREKKDDPTWKIATVGLIPIDPSQFVFHDTAAKKSWYDPGADEDYLNPRSDDDFTAFSDTKISDDEPLTDQLKKHLKKLLYSRRKSASEFYDERKMSDTDVSVRMRD